MFVDKVDVCCTYIGQANPWNGRGTSQSRWTGYNIYPVLCREEKKLRQEPEELQTAFRAESVYSRPAPQRCLAIIPAAKTAKNNAVNRKTNSKSKQINATREKTIFTCHEFYLLFCPAQWSC